MPRDGGLAEVARTTGVGPCSFTPASQWGLRETTWILGRLKKSLLSQDSSRNRPHFASRHLLSHPEIRSYKRKVILGRPSATGICRHKRRVPQRALTCSRPPRFFTVFRASAGSLPHRLHKWPDYRSEKHKILFSSLHRISDFSYKTLITSIIREIIKGFAGKVGLLQQSACSTQEWNGH